MSMAQTEHVIPAVSVGSCPRSLLGPSDHRENSVIGGRAVPRQSKHEHSGKICSFDLLDPSHSIYATIIE